MTFVDYPDFAEYKAARDKLTAEFENYSLYLTGGNSGFYYDGTAINIGFGFNITANTSDAQSLLSSVGLAFTPNQWALIKQAASQPSNSTADALNQALGTTITQSQAYQLMDEIYDDPNDLLEGESIESQLDQTLGFYGIVPDSTFANSITRAGLADEFYNTAKGVVPVSAFGQSSAAAFAAGDIGGVAYQTAFFTNSSKSAGTATRRLAEAFTQLGGIVSIDGTPTITSVDFTNARIGDIVSFAQHVALNNFLVQSYLSAFSKALASFNLGFGALQTTLTNAGLHVIQPDDTQATLSFSYGVSYAQLQQINSIFADSNFGIGGLIHVPTGVTSLSSIPVSLPPLPAQHTYVFDPNTGNVYTVGSSVDGSNANELIVDTTGQVIPAGGSGVVQLSSGKVTGSETVNFPGGDPAYITGITLDGITLGTDAPYLLGSILDLSALQVLADGSLETTATVGPTGGSEVASLDFLERPDGSVSIIAIGQAGQSQTAFSSLPGQLSGDEIDEYLFSANGVPDQKYVEFYISRGGILNNINIVYSILNNGSIGFDNGASSIVDTILSGQNSSVGISDLSGYHGLIQNFQAGDTIDLQSFLTDFNSLNRVFGAQVSYYVNISQNTLNYGITIGSTKVSSDTDSINLTPYIGYSPSSAYYFSDGAGGLDIVTYNLPNTTVTSNSNTATVAVQTGYTVDLDGFLNTLQSPTDTAIIQGPGLAEIEGAVSISSLEIASGGDLLLQGGVLKTDPVTIDADGNISGYGTITGSETANGTVTADSGTLDITGDVTGSGTLTFVTGAILQLEGTVATTESLTFTGSAETLTLGPNANVMAPISGFGAGDALNLEGQQVSSAMYDTGTHVLAITGSGGSVYDLTFVGTYQQSDFPVINAEVVMPCFLRGTRIATAAGEVPVEELAIGEPVPTHGGGLMPIKWIGHRHVDCRRRPDPRKVWPVRVRAGAFGERMPCRDLWLSPDHAVFVDDVLIPIQYLINGSTIAQEPRDEVTYYHVELARHDVLLAEGLPCESYLDTGNRANFADGSAPLALHPDFSAWTWEALGYAPLIVTGPVFEAVRRRLHERSSDVAAQRAA